jgi:hypothetical protein
MLDVALLPFIGEASLRSWLIAHGYDAVSNEIERIKTEIDIGDSDDPRADMSMEIHFKAEGKVAYLKLQEANFCWLSEDQQKYSICLMARALVRAGIRAALGVDIPAEPKGAPGAGDN